MKNKHKILVVDDHNENIRIIGSVLRQNNYKVGFATRGKHALEILNNQKENYDLILLDVNMPEMDGYEVCKRIRADENLFGIPVIFLTANTEPGHVKQGFDSGGQDYVTKPFHSEELLARIKTHIELKENRDQLKEMNAILEEKVRERTQELEVAKKNLEKANQELEALDENKADFLRLISHEINTPLNGIIGFTEILKDLLNSTEYFSLINYLSEAAHRLNEFAQSSLIITKMRTSPEKYLKTAFNIKATIEEILARKKEEIEQKKIKVNFQSVTDNPKLNGNEDLIKIGMDHILMNAIHFTPENTSITIDIYNDDSNLIVSFTDSGPGFSENAFRNLFKTFSTGEEHVDKNKGLGLSLVKMIVDFHRAKIYIENQEKVGAKVSLVFNLVDS